MNTPKPKTYLTRIGLITASALLFDTSQAQVLPYSDNSTAENLLDFQNGPGGSVMADLPGFTTVIAYNNAVKTGSGGDWNLSAQGSTSIGLITPLGSSRAETSVSSNGLEFSIVNDGIGNLIGVNLNQRWGASTTIADSVNWQSANNQFIYEFDLGLSSALLSGDPGIFSGLTLTISDSVSTLYQGTGATGILGLVTLTDSSYVNQRVNFTYNPANGPIRIEWAAEAAVTLGLLQLVNNGTTDIYSIRNGDIMVQPVPEPSYVMLLGSLLPFFIFRRR